MKAPLSSAEKRYTMAEIAEALGLSKQAAQKRANKEAWPAEKAGRGLTYPLATLPKDLRDALQQAALSRQIAAMPGPVSPPAVVSTPAPTTVPMVAAALSDRQIDIERARERLIGFIQGAAEGSVPRVIDRLNADWHAGRLDGPLSWAFAHAWDKKRADARLTVKTYYNWLKLKETRGRAAPKKVPKDMEIKPWYGLLLALRQRPQGSCLTWIAEQIAAEWQPGWGEQPPSYHSVRRVLNAKISQADQLKGRLTGSALSAHLRYQKRSSAGLQPWDEIHADGWNTHFTAPHPVSGEYVTYEVWHAHDVATRYVPPFGIGLTENFEVILKCIENVVRDGGCPLIVQTDSTKIVKNSAQMKTDPSLALSQKVGFTFVHPVKVGNSQANGIAENFNVWLGRECKELATYQADDMDSLSFKRVKKLTAKAVRAHKANDLDTYTAALREAGRMGKGLVLQSHEEALAWLEAKRQKWNAKPHRSLPRVRDAQTGTLRHQSPNEAMAAARQAGWTPDLFGEDYLIALFRPHKRVTVRREQVRPYGDMFYAHEALSGFNNQEVVVAYDLMDWRQVWVKTLALEPICTALFAESTGYRTRSAYDVANEKRAQAQIKHRERQIEAIRERAGMDGETLEGEALRVTEQPAIEAEVIRLTPRLSDEEMAEIEARQARKRAKPMTMQDMAMWLYGDEIAAKDKAGEPPIKESAAV